MVTIVIFDVGNGSCALIVDDLGNSLMIDCGSHAKKVNPVHWIYNQTYQGGWLEQMKFFQKIEGGWQAFLTKLVISHPDLDHIKNAKQIAIHLMPFLIESREIRCFPKNLLATNTKEFQDFRLNFCGSNWLPSAMEPNW